MPLVEFMYLLFTRMPGESYRRSIGSLFVCLFVSVTSFERKLTPLCVDSARALWASFCFTRCVRTQLVFLVFAVNSLCTYTTCVSCSRCKPLEHLVQALFIIWSDNISFYLVSALVLSAEGTWSSHDLTLAGNIEALLPTPRENSGRGNLWIWSRWQTAST